MVKDRFGNSWSIATHEEDVSADEMGKRAPDWYLNWVINPR
jgi:hypothetical protein